MLRITIQDDSEIRLKLEGRLAGPWAAELQQCCCTASSTTRHKQLIIDLTDLESTDARGRSLLALLHQHGAKFIATSLTMRQLVSEITGEPKNEILMKPEEE